MRRLLLLCLSLAPLLGGCVAAVVGGAAAGGYAAGKDERSASVMASDGRITTAVKARLVADSELKALDINVDTYDSVVTLRGNVRRAAQSSAAEREARAVAGVKSVHNELKVN